MKKYILISVLLFCVYGLSAQEKDGFLKAALSRSVSKQKTANTQDILTNLFRAGIDNFLGDDRKFSFSSSFFGIDSIFRSKKAEPLSFCRERSLRNHSFDITVEGDSSNNITKIGGGFTFTLINKKDIECKKVQQKDFARLKNDMNLFAEITKSATLRAEGDINSDASLNSSEKMNLKKAMNDSWNEADQKHDYSLLHSRIINALKFIQGDATTKIALVQKIPAEKNSLVTQEDFDKFIGGYIDGKDVFQEDFEYVAEKYARKPLLTFSPNIVYDRVNKQSVFSFASNFTAGIGKVGKKPWEVEIKSLFKVENDTSIKKTNYDNKLLSVSAGVNKVLLQNSEKESRMEFKFFSQYDYQFGNLAMGSHRSIFTLNTTLRINVFKSLWLPITLKYDPYNHNFLGLFSLTANLGS
jgi:hypothetical protein